MSMYNVTLLHSTFKIIHIMVYTTNEGFVNTITFYKNNDIYLSRFNYYKKEIIKYLLTLGYIKIVTAINEQDKYEHASYQLQLTSKTLLKCL
jgi:hypothetical protein